MGFTVQVSLKIVKTNNLTIKVVENFFLQKLWMEVAITILWLGNQVMLKKICNIVVKSSILKESHYHHGILLGLSNNAGKKNIYTL